MRVLFATVAAAALFLAGSGSLGPQAAAASPQAARPIGPVTGAALQHLVVGHTESGTGPHGTFWKRFAADGTLTGSVTNGVGGDQYYISGRWKFKGGRICDSWTLSSGSYSSHVCQAISWNGKNFVSTIKRSYGEVEKIIVHFK